MTFQTYKILDRNVFKKSQKRSLSNGKTKVVNRNLTYARVLLEGTSVDAKTGATPTDGQ